MQERLLVILVTALLSQFAVAAGSHSGGHDDHSTPVVQQKNGGQHDDGHAHGHGNDHHGDEPAGGDDVQLQDAGVEVAGDPGSDDAGK